MSLDKARCPSPVASSDAGYRKDCVVFLALGKSSFGLTKPVCPLCFLIQGKILVIYAFFFVRRVRKQHVSGGAAVREPRGSASYCAGSDMVNVNQWFDILRMFTLVCSVCSC